MRFTAELWRYEGQAAWWFLTVPAPLSEEIRAQTDDARPGFGSVRVQVTVGSTTWQTSVFPDSRSGTYVLPVKKDVRRREDLLEGDQVDVALEVLDR